LTLTANVLQELRLHMANIGSALPWVSKFCYAALCLQACSTT